mmetsp:Transcript_7645/g.15731  ORF Transcript_7645/g.15731 Transcript_7645/m.15731 type:complete len:374 (+) Transcript_7645:88-1209(+)
MLSTRNWRPFVVGLLSFLQVGTSFQPSTQQRHESAVRRIDLSGRLLLEYGGHDRYQPTAGRCRNGDIRLGMKADEIQDNERESVLANPFARRRRHFLQASLSALVGGCFTLPPENNPTIGSGRAIAASDDPTPSNTGAPSLRRLGGLPSKIRRVGRIMDELQRDLMQERWDLVEEYPAQLRSYVPVFTTYTDSAFPSDAPTDKGLRVALRYEVGRFFASLQRLKQACSRKNLDEAYVAFADMSLHFDRYLRVGGLYSFYDDLISTEPYFKGISDSDLVFANPTKDPPLVRDLVVLIKGPEKGKTGILIGKYPDGSQKMVVKLDRYKGMREIRVVQNSWVAKRLGEQDPDDVFLIPRSTSSTTTTNTSIQPKKY